jgi:hypothetical protein
LDLPTYTNIWRIEKRLYKLYDFRLPMPLPVGQIAVFAAIAVPYVVILKLAGLPFSHTLLWLYILPPGAMAWLVTRPVLEGKRLPELVVSQVRYLAEPRTWCRMAPLAEKDEITIVARVWHRLDTAADGELAVVEAAEYDLADVVLTNAVLTNTVLPDAVRSDSVRPESVLAGNEPVAAGEPAVVADREAPTAAHAGAHPVAYRPPPPARPAPVPRPEGPPPSPGRTWPEIAAPSRQSMVRRGPVRPAAFSRLPSTSPAVPPGRQVPEQAAGAAPAPPVREAPVQPAAPAAPGVPAPPVREVPEQAARAVPAPPVREAPVQPAAPAVPPPPVREAPVQPPAAPAPSAREVPEQAAGPAIAPAAREAPEQTAPAVPAPPAREAPDEPAHAAPVADTPVADAPVADTPVADGPPAPPASPAPAPRSWPVVTVTGDQRGERPVRMVERALGNRSERRTVSWHDHVVVVPGGHRPGRPDQLQRDRARARLAVPGGHRIVVLGCTVGAGQTVTTLLTGEVLASLRDDQVAVLDLNPGPGSLADRARVVPALNPSQPPAPSRLEVVTREAEGDAENQGDVTKIFELLSARYPITLADPGAAAVPRVLATASQLILVAPASQDAASALATTREWLEAHGHAELADGAITVLNGVSRHTMPHVEQAEALARGRCRAIVRVPWDDHLKKPEPERNAPPTPGAPSALPSPGSLSPATLHAYTALAGVLVAALVSSAPEQMRARP